MTDEYQEIQPRVAEWDMTCRIHGDGCDMLVTVGVRGARPTDQQQGLFRRKCERHFTSIFGVGWETSGTTVGPHEANGEDDHQVG
jgi:hypothetical protein